MTAESDAVLLCRMACAIEAVRLTGEGGTEGTLHGRCSCLTQCHSAVMVLHSAVERLFEQLEDYTPPTMIGFSSEVDEAYLTYLSAVASQVFSLSLLVWTMSAALLSEIDLCRSQLEVVCSAQTPVLDSEHWLRSSGVHALESVLRRCERQTNPSALLTDILRGDLNNLLGQKTRGGGILKMKLKAESVLNWLYKADVPHPSLDEQQSLTKSTVILLIITGLANGQVNPSSFQKALMLRLAHPYLLIATGASVVDVMAVSPTYALTATERTKLRQHFLLKGADDPFGLSWAALKRLRLAVTSLSSRLHDADSSKLHDTVNLRALTRDWVLTVIDGDNCLRSCVAFKSRLGLPLTYTEPELNLLASFTISTCESSIGLWQKHSDWVLQCCRAKVLAGLAELDTALHGCLESSSPETITLRDAVHHLKSRLAAPGVLNSDELSGVPAVQGTWLRFSARCAATALEHETRRPMLDKGLKGFALSVAKDLKHYLRFHEICCAAFMNKTYLTVKLGGKAQDDGIETNPTLLEDCSLLRRLILHCASNTCFLEGSPPDLICGPEHLTALLQVSTCDLSLVRETIEKLAERLFAAAKVKAAGELANELFFDSDDLMAAARKDFVPNSLLALMGTGTRPAATTISGIAIDFEREVDECLKSLVMASVSSVINSLKSSPCCLRALVNAFGALKCASLSVGKIKDTGCFLATLSWESVCQSLNLPHILRSSAIEVMETLSSRCSMLFLDGDGLGVAFREEHPPHSQAQLPPFDFSFGTVAVSMAFQSRLHRRPDLPFSGDCIDLLSLTCLLSCLGTTASDTLLRMWSSRIGFELQACPHTRRWLFVMKNSNGNFIVDQILHSNERPTPTMTLLTDAINELQHNMQASLLAMLAKIGSHVALAIMVDQLQQRHHCGADKTHAALHQLLTCPTLLATAAGLQPLWLHAADSGQAGLHGIQTLKQLENVEQHLIRFFAALNKSGRTAPSVNSSEWYKCPAKLIGMVILLVVGGIIADE